MNDTRVCLGEVADINMGTSPPGSTYNRAGDGVPLLNGPTEFGPRSPQSTVFTTAPVRTCEPGDLLFCVRGSTTGRMNHADRQYALGRGVCAIRGAQHADTAYLQFILQHDLARLLQLAGGTTFPNLDRRTLAAFEIPYPSCRHAIASMLSAYDDLIENNRRRIALLEESARLLYREWFVHLRFPGHENTPIKDGLPEGWERTTLGDLADVQKGQNITKETVASGSVPVVAGGLEPAYLHDTANAAAPVITISASGANSGHVALYQQDIWASDCSYISGATTPHIFFVYLALKAQQLALTAMQLGAAQPHVYPKDIKRLAIPYPDDITLGRFTGTVAPMFLQVRCLQAQNSKLAAARDLLLPRLMSGEIEV